MNPRYASGIAPLVFSITRAAGRFVLVGPDGAEVLTSHRPRVLSRLAFDQGATTVEHNYDLKLDPDN